MDGNRELPATREVQKDTVHASVERGVLAPKGVGSHDTSHMLWT